MISAAPVVTAAPMVTLARDQLPQILLTVNTQLIILPYAAAVVAVGGPLESLMTASIVDASAAMTSRTVHGPVWCP